MSCAAGGAAATTLDYRAYHDEEWGMPVTDDRAAVREARLEGFQSGPLLAHDPAQAGGVPPRLRRTSTSSVVARFGARTSSGCSTTRRSCVIAGRSSRRSTTPGARSSSSRRRVACGVRLALRARRPRTARDDPRRAQGAARRPTPRRALAKELKRRGWSFVGPTTVYAFMQAMGSSTTTSRAATPGRASSGARSDQARPSE